MRSSGARPSRIFVRGRNSCRPRSSIAPTAAQRSAAANLLGVLVVTTPAPSREQDVIVQLLRRAASYFQQAIAIDPLFTLAHYSLGQAHMNLQRYASAIKAFKDCIEASRTLFGLAETNRFAVEKQREDEIHEMRESVKRLHALGPGYALRATRAEQQLRDLETQKPSLGRGFQPPAEALLSLGSAYFRIDERDQAEAEWRAAIEVNPRLGEAHNNLAVILMQTGRFDDAEREIKAAEKAGFRVNPQLKSDLKQAAGRR
jgi:tetratricopeptide (TPR) repeat protein